jgi:hypothetical protein
VSFMLCSVGGGEGGHDRVGGRRVRDGMGVSEVSRKNKKGGCYHPR